MKVIRVQNPADFDATIAAIDFDQSQVFVVFIGSEDPMTGESWCKDCVIADPAIRKGVGTISNSILIECPVGERSAYKNVPDHPYRVHPLIKLERIPTLVHWTKSGSHGRLVEGECATFEQVQAFVAEHTSHKH
eukprot:TRINITY_DN7267_c0_g1_i1.p1 TRINITY_DN7267_c0_g1~~TRINITY_DN7267_c0_g1_i1.p1  ORF type:complete len:134 (-),score=27.76 TRINITY_DN7267_c0_g1_i1:254-655(-)